MATTEDLRAVVERLLYGSGGQEHPEEDTLGANLAQAVTSATFSDGALWQKGDYAEFPTSSSTPGEVVILADDADDSTGVATIRRAQLATGDVAHTSGDVVRRNPKFPQIDVDRAVDMVVDNDLEDAWYYSNRTIVAATLTSGDTIYSLNAADIDVVDVYQHDLNSSADLHPIHRGLWEVKNQVHSDIDATEKVLILRHVHDFDATLYYTARTRPTSSNLTDLPTELENAIPFGAAAKLLGGYRTGPRHTDPVRRADQELESPVRDWRFYQGEFERLKAKYLKNRRLDVPRPRSFRRGYRRIWTW